MMKNKLQKQTIKEFAGEILLYLYLLQRNRYSALGRQQFKFELYGEHDDIYLINKKDDIDEFMQKYNDSDLYNALKYLQNKKFVQFAGGSRDNIGESFYVIELTDIGVDIIEGVEREVGKEKYKITFNFNLNIDALLKVDNNINLESIIKASIL